MSSSRSTPRTVSSTEASELAAIVSGLQASPQKTLHPKYLYDARGSELFDRICELEAYYPTKTEIGILDRYAPEIAAKCGTGALIVEYGAGSSIKIRKLLDAFVEPAGVILMDISEEHLEAAARRLAGEYPDIPVHSVCADYTSPFAVPKIDAKTRVGFFPGSTIGNFEPDEAVSFLRRIARAVGDGYLVIGADRKKDIARLQAAYDDDEGVTAEFNLNVLRHLNERFDADFDLDGFEHRAVWNEELGRIEMHLVSQREQRAHIGGASIHFNAGETIHTESSHKFSIDDFRSIAESAGFTTEEVWSDDEQLFSVYLLRGALSS